MDVVMKFGRAETPRKIAKPTVNGDAMCFTHKWRKMPFSLTKALTNAKLGTNLRSLTFAKQQMPYAHNQND